MAGFWIRCGAFFIDFIILAFVGGLLGFCFSHFFISLGNYAPLVGFVIALLYFGYFDSYLGNGQTPGKRQVKIKVVNARDRHLSPFRAGLRFTFFSFPFFIDKINLLNVLTNSEIHQRANSFLAFWMLAMIYLAFFNSKTRQNLHDLAVGSYVVSTRHPGTLSPQPMWKGHLLIMALLLILTIAGNARFGKSDSPFLDRQELQKVIRDNPEILSISSKTQTESDSEDDSNDTTNLIVTVQCQRRIPSQRAITRQLVQMVLNHAPLGNLHYITIKLSSGYSIGIYESYKTKTFRHTPDEWKAILADPQKQP